MSLQVLVIEDKEVYRRLLAHHVSSGFDNASVVDYDPAAQGRLPADFPASAYDAILLGDSGGLERLRDLTGRDGFPPVYYLLSEWSPEAREQALAAGAAWGGDPPPGGRTRRWATGAGPWPARPFARE